MLYVILLICTLLHKTSQLVIGVDSGAFRVRMYHYDNAKRDYSSITDENSSSLIKNSYYVSPTGEVLYGATALENISQDGYHVPYGIQTIYNEAISSHLSDVATFDLDLSTIHKTEETKETSYLPSNSKLYARGSKPKENILELERILAHHFNYLNSLIESSAPYKYPVNFSIPHYYSALTRAAIKEASILAKFPISNLMVENSALLLGVASKIPLSKIKSNRIVLVDIGHVSSSFTLADIYTSESYAKLNPDNNKETCKRVVDVVKTVKHPFCGLKVSIILYKHLKEKLENLNKNKVEKLTEEEKIKLFIETDKIKEKLSTATKTKLLFTRSNRTIVDLLVERRLYEDDKEFKLSVSNFFKDLKKFTENLKTKNFILIPYGGTSLLPLVKENFNKFYKEQFWSLLRPTDDLGQHLALFELQKNFSFKKENRILIKERIPNTYFFNLSSLNGSENAIDSFNGIKVEKELWKENDIMEGKKVVEIGIQNLKFEEKGKEFQVVIKSGVRNLESEFIFKIEKEFIKENSTENKLVFTFSFDKFRNVQYHLILESILDNKVEKRRITVTKKFPVFDENGLKEIGKELKRINKAKEEKKELGKLRNQLDYKIIELNGELENEESYLFKFGGEKEIKELQKYLKDLEGSYEENKFNLEVFTKKRILDEFGKLKDLTLKIDNREREHRHLENKIKEVLDYIKVEKEKIDRRLESWAEQKTKQATENENEEENKQENNENDNKEENKEKEEQKEEKEKEKKKLTKEERYLKLKEFLEKRENILVRRLEELKTWDLKTDFKTSILKLNKAKFRMMNKVKYAEDKVMREDLMNNPEVQKMIEQIKQKQMKEAMEAREKEEREKKEKEEKDKMEEEGEVEDEVKDKKTEDKEDGKKKEVSDEGSEKEEEL